MKTIVTGTAVLVVLGVSGLRDAFSEQLSFHTDGNTGNLSAQNAQNTGETLQPQYNIVSDVNQKKTLPVASIPKDLVALPRLEIAQPASAGNASTIKVLDFGRAPWQYPKFSFIGHEKYSGTPGAGIGAAVQGLEIQMFKDPSSAPTSGSRQAFTAAQQGVLGGQNDEFSGGFESVIATVDPNGFNNSGFVYGNNTSVLVPAGMNPTVVYSNKIDIQNHSTTLKRIGESVLDINSTVGGSAADAAWAADKNPKALGFYDGILFGTDTDHFPLQPGGTFLTTTNSDVALDSFLDFSRMVKQPNTGGILLKPNFGSKALCFGLSGGAECPGGSVGSLTKSNGGKILFGDSALNFQIGSTDVLSVDPGGLMVKNSTATCTFSPTTAATSWACSSDENLKSSIADSMVTTDWIKTFRVRDFVTKSDGTTHTGVVAQELRMNHPEMVHNISDGRLTAEAPNPWAMIKVMQSLVAENRALEEELRLVELLLTVTMTVIFLSKFRRKYKTK